MCMNDCASVGPIDVDVAMEAPLRRRQPRPGRCTAERHGDNVFRTHRFVRQPGRRNQETTFGPRTDIAGLAVVDAALVHLNFGRNDRGAQVEFIPWRCSGNIAARSSADARQMPRSVISPVRSRAGVTSNAGFMTGVPGGAIASPTPW